MPDLALGLPWIAPTQRLGDLRVRRGSANTLTYDDGIDLAVRVLDPGEFESADGLIAHADHAVEPGTVVLVAGVVPVAWRPKLRAAEVSFVDVSGVAEINWPRVRFSTGQFARPIQRKREFVPMQKGHAVVVQQLLAASFAGDRPTIGELAQSAAVGLSTASRSMSQLAAHGLVDKHKDGPRMRIEVLDPVALAELLCSRTPWPHGQLLSGYLWGRNIWDVAASLSSRAARCEVELAVTGRTALAFLGILGTSPPRLTRCWVAANDQDLERIGHQIGLEPAPEEESNVVFAPDPWRVGVHGRATRKFDEWEAKVAHPLRIWCDLREEPRGTEFAAQLWKEIGRGG